MTSQPSLVLSNSVSNLHFFRCVSSFLNARNYVQKLIYAWCSHKGSQRYSKKCNTPNSRQRTWDGHLDEVCETSDLVPDCSKDDHPHNLQRIVWRSCDVANY